MFKKNLVLSTAIITLFVFGLSFLNACKKQSCYDAAMAAQYKDSFCTADCPGVTGCDGKTYCNECEARRNGITVVD